MSSGVRQTTERLLQPILERRELSLFDIEYVKEGKDWFLRVFIDKKGGVDIDECGLVSSELSDKLDELDLVKGSYFLEVSSPGVERPLKSKQDMIDHVGENIYVTLYLHIEGENNYEGILKGFKDDVATIEFMVKTRKKEVQIPYDKIASARLAVAL